MPDPWEIQYAKPSNGNPWEMQYAAPAPPPEKGFVERAGNAFSDAWNVLAPTPGQPIENKIGEMAKGVASLPGQVMEARNDLIKALANGDQWEVAKAAAGKIPLFGAAGKQIIQNIHDGDYGAAMGHLLGLGSQANPEGALSAAESIPARAAAASESVARAGTVLKAAGTGAIQEAGGALLRGKPVEALVKALPSAIERGKKAAAELPLTATQKAERAARIAEREPIWQALEIPESLPTPEQMPLSPSPEDIMAERLANRKSNRSQDRNPAWKGLEVPAASAEQEIPPLAISPQEVMAQRLADRKAANEARIKQVQVNYPIQEAANIPPDLLEVVSQQEHDVPFKALNPQKKMQVILKAKQVLADVEARGPRPAPEAGPIVEPSAPTVANSAQVAPPVPVEPPPTQAAALPAAVEPTPVPIAAVQTPPSEINFPHPIADLPFPNSKTLKPVRLVTNESVARWAEESGQTNSAARAQLAEAGYSVGNRTDLNRNLHDVAKYIGMDHETLSSAAKEAYGVESMKDLTEGQMLEFAKNLYADMSEGRGGATLKNKTDKRKAEVSIQQEHTPVNLNDLMKTPEMRKMYFELLKSGTPGQEAARLVLEKHGPATNPKSPRMEAIERFKEGLNK